MCKNTYWPDHMQHMSSSVGEQKKQLKNQKKEKYLGDYLNKYANSLDTMEEKGRKERASYQI